MRQQRLPPISCGRPSAPCSKVHSSLRAKTSTHSVLLLSTAADVLFRALSAGHAAGNPTNIIVAMAYRLGFLEYSKWMALPTIGTNACTLHMQPHCPLVHQQQHHLPARLLGILCVCGKTALHPLIIVSCCNQTGTQRLPDASAAIASLHPLG